MDNYRIIKMLEKICDSKDNYNESAIYYKIYFLSVIIGAGVSIPGLQLSILIYTKAVLIFSIVIFFGISLFYFLINETSRIQSINALYSVITRLQYGDWQWVKTALIKRPVQLHPTVVRHPVTLFIIGNYLTNREHLDIGKSLIKVAIQKAPKLRNIRNYKSLDQRDAEYFYELLLEDKGFKWFYLFQLLWRNKILRFLLITVTLVVLGLHYSSL